MHGGGHALPVDDDLQTGRIRRDSRQRGRFPVHPRHAIDVARRELPPTHEHAGRNGLVAAVMHDRGIVVRATAADIEPGFTVPGGNDHVGISVWPLMLVPQTDGMADLVDRGSDAAALGVHKPDRLRTTLAADLCNARAMIWFKRFGAETDEVRLGLARHQLHDRLRVPVTDRLFDISPSPFREARLDDERDDSLWPKQFGSR